MLINFNIFFLKFIQHPYIYYGFNDIYIHNKQQETRNYPTEKNDPTDYFLTTRLNF